MQNVIIQMGFVLLTTEGARLKRVRRYKLLCRGCIHLNMDGDRKFCEKCGGMALTKVSVFIDEKGDITFFDNPKRRINLRGTIFSMPKPKGGRLQKVNILREDETMYGMKAMLMRQMQRDKTKQANAIKATLDGDYWAGGQGYTAGVSSLLYENGAKGGTKARKQQELKFGYGKANKNQVNRKRK